MQVAAEPRPPGLCSGSKTKLPPVILVSCLLPCQPAGKVSKAPWAPSFPKEWVPPGRARTKQKALWEPYPPPKPQVTHIPILSLDTHLWRSCSTTGEEGRERGHSPQPPARRGGCWHEGRGPLEPQDERAAGRPWAHAGAQDAASSSWTPGSSGLLPPSPHPSFLFRGHQRQRDLRGQNIACTRTLTHTHRHLYPHLSNPPSPPF